MHKFLCRSPRRRGGGAKEKAGNPQQHYGPRTALSEDSDYTSDVSFPIHQPNSSVSQFGGPLEVARRAVAAPEPSEPLYYNSRPQDISGNTADGLDIYMELSDSRVEFHISCSDTQQHCDKESGHSKIITVFNWFNEFKFRKTNFENEPRSGRPPTAVTRDKFELRRSKNYISTVREKCGLWIGSNHLKYRKLVSRWLPQSLTEDQKLCRVKWCNVMLKKLMKANQRLFLILLQVTKLGFIILIQKQNGNILFGALQNHLS
ncbi:hypothetical protein LAZ67_15002642 [Cordylochernes scorpioides]|uniref:Uncharacterized protein n=1 Tax=Cordylochernes scorpioides TaxID=51811 RepID=A0ABY6LBR6_9ARAC|nr:hypothetical protein LAZ67_15002642 [Cordylochernes scorpioides]